MPNSNFGNIQYKASNGLINLDEAQGIVECFVSGIGNKDSVGDICATGAFAKSLQRRKPRVVWGHNWNDPIGKVLEIYEVPASDQRLPMKMKMAGIGGLYAKVQFNLQSEKGKEAFANVAFFGEEQEWSIGYKTLRAQYDDNLQANVLYEVELYEVSPVLHGANQLTGTISVKSDEEKMHGMMPMVIGSPAPQGPRRDGLFDEGVSQRISGPQLAGVVAELSRRAAGPVMVVEATENSIVFVKPGKGKFRIGYHFTGSEYMFGKPELIQAEQPKPAVQSGPSPIPGVVAKPSKPSTNNPGMAMPVAMKPVNGGMVMVPLAPVEYEGSDKNKKPELGAEESELAESLVRIASKYGKFDEDGDGIWAGYYPPAENKVKDIGVKCSNCVLYQGEGKCKILDFKVEDEAKCRFAIIPDGVVVGFGKKQYNDILDDDEIKMVEDIEAKYPGEFILGALRNTVKKRRKKRRSYKTLEEWGTEERELEEKGLDSFLAQDQSYVIPVNLEDAFYFKSVIDPVLEYHRIDTTVNEYGIVINSPLDQESKDAISAATNSAYALLKKKIASSSIEEKALGRRIASRAIDRPNIGGKKRRGGRGMGVPSGDLDPRTRRDSNLDGTLFDNVPGWEQPDPTPDGPGSINNPKPSRRQLVDTAKPDGKEKLSSGTRNLRRHADRSEDMEKQFPNAEENQKRIDHEAIAKAWEEQGLGWQEVPRYNSDSNFSSDYLRGREIGVNQSRVMWNGDSVRKRPAKFNEKAKASIEYSDWFSSYIRSVGAYIDAHSKDDSDNWDGIESAIKDDVKAKYPDVRERSKEYIANLNQSLNSLGLLDAGDKKKKLKKVKKGEDSQGGPDLQELRKLNSEGKLSSGKEDSEVDAEFLKAKIKETEDRLNDLGDNPLLRDERRALQARIKYAKELLKEKNSQKRKPSGPSLSSGGLAERLKEIDGLSAEETFIPYRRGVLARGPQPSDLQREMYEEFARYGNQNDVWDYLNTRYSVEKSDYEYRPGDDGYFSESEPNYNLNDAIKDSMSEEDMRNFLKATAEHEASPDYDAYKKGGPLYDELNKDGKLSSGRTAGSGRFVADLEKQMAKDTEPLDISAYGAGQYEMFNRSRDNNPELDFDVEVQDELMSHQDGAELVGHTVKLTDGRRGVVVSGTGPEYELLERDEFVRGNVARMYSGDIAVLITTDKDGNTLDKFIEQDFDFNLESNSRVIDPTMDWDKEIEESKTDGTVGALVEKNRITDSLLEQVSKSERMSSGKKDSSRLSSGGTPDSDTQKRLIDSAESAAKKKSDGTESFAASVARQYRKGGKLSEKQWAALDKMFGGSKPKSAPEASRQDSPSIPFSNKKRAITELESIPEYDYPKVAANRKPTVEQARAIDAMMTGEDVKISALAATGKTTTVINFAERLKDVDPSARVLYLVFNKNAKDDVAKRGMPDNVNVMTMDGVSYNAMRSINPQMTTKSFDQAPGHIKPIKTFGDRASYLGVKSMVDEGQELSATDVYKRVSKAVDAFAISSDSEIGEQHFTGAYNGNMAVDNPEIIAELIPFAKKMWADMNTPRVAPKGSGKGEGMLPMTNTHITKMWALTNPDIGNSEMVNVAMVDEAQDMNPVFAGILKGSNGIQRVYIGDTNQAINAWRGADGKTLNDAYAKYDMPITDSFRFGKEIAGMGNRFLSLLGRKERMTGKKTDQSGSAVDGIIGQINNPTMILTRSNGGAIAATLDSFKKGLTVFGSKNFKNDLGSFIDNIEYMTTKENGTGYFTDSKGGKIFGKPKESQDLDGISNIREFNKAIEDADNNRLNMLGKIIAENSFEELRVALDKIITDRKNLPKNRDEYVHIQTAHTSKGLESPRVKIWTDFRKPKKDENGNVLMPNEQELRLSYVAVTRAEEELDLGSLGWITEFTTDEDGEPSKLSSGSDASRILGRSIEKPETEKLITSDREIFERRMGGESLAETAAALGIRREDVAQAEKRHMARMRGTLSTLDADDAEAYRQEQYRMAEENAADEALNRYINEQISSGSSLDAVAKELSISKEQVRARNNAHIDLLKSEDAAAEEFLSRVSVRRSSGDQGPPRSQKDYVSPLEGMEPGQKLSSGKMDEVYRSVQEKLIEQIEKIQETGDGKWEFPWHKTALPKNVTNNNRPYSGINSMMLMFKQDAMGYDTPLWAGFNQWKKEGGSVRKGEKGTMIMIPTVLPKKKDADGKEIASSGGIFFKTGHVFNIDQIDGIDKDKFKIAELPEAERVAELEQALSEVGAVVNHGGDRAFYRPSTDEITLPPFASFKSKEGYYAVFAHELMHWTGHSSRLNRDHLGDFGSPEYAQEELIAEIASAFFMAAHGLTPEPREDHAQYLAGWLKRLKSDPDAMKKAFGEAQKAHDFAISKSPSMSKKLGKKVAEAGAIPGNNDGGYGEITPSLSSGARDRYVRNPEGTIRTLADEMGAFGDELLTRFQMAQGPRDGDRNWFEDYADLGESRSLNQWSISEDEFGNWSAELLRLEFGNGYTEREPGGLISDEFKSPEDAAKWIASYESTRQEWSKKFKQEKDVEKISNMLDEELARRDAEYQDYARISRERSDRQQYVRMIADINESRLDWTMDDWADEASDIQMELSRENSRLSSGMRSRYDDKPVEEIGLVSDALKRTDEAGSNARHIASNLLMVPVEKYDFDAIRRNGEVISFSYNGKPRMVYPTGMMTKKGGGVYFIGLDEESGQYRSFSLHKIDGIIDGADAPYNPTQPGVPQGAPRSSAQRTRSITSDRLSSGKVRPLNEVRAEIEEDAQYENTVVQRAFGGTLGRKDKRGFFATIPLEDHAEAIQSLDRLVALRDDLLRSLLDGKKMPALSSIFEVDQYAPVAEDDLDLLINIDDAVDSIHSELGRTEETFSKLNDEVDELKESISKLENSFRTPQGTTWKIRGPVNFESAMEKHIEDADGDAAEALYYMKNDAESIIDILDEIDNAEDRLSILAHEEQIAEIKELIDSIDGGDVTPEDFASKLSDLFYKNVNGLERELSELLKNQTNFENNGVTTDREDITGIPRDVFSSSTLPNFEMAKGNASNLPEPGDAPGLSSGRKKRTQGAKRRPMSDADRQAFADGVRQRAATIPGKKRPGPSKDEFGDEKFSSGRLRFPGTEKRKKIGKDLEQNVGIKFGKMSENDGRSPDGKWMLDARKLQQILKDENGKPLSKEQTAEFLGLIERRHVGALERMFQDGAGISEADVYAIIDRSFSDGSNPFDTSDIIDGIWGFGAKPYWYDKDGNQLTKEQYDDFLDEGIYMYGLLSPEGMVEEEQFVGAETSKEAFPMSALASYLNIESDKDLAKALTFEINGEQITASTEQTRRWRRDGIPTAIIEQLVDRGVIPSAADVFGEEGAKFDNSIRQFDLWKKVSDTIAKKVGKVKGVDLDEIIGAKKVQTRLRLFDEGKEGKFNKNTGKALRYSDDEVQTIVDRLNKKYDLSETVESIKGGGSMSSGRRAARRISTSGQDAVEKLSAGRENNGAPENITPRMQNEIIGWAKNAKWSGFAQSVLSQFEANGFLSPSQWTKLLQLRDNSQRRR
jgi:HK97 family phage prohead protease